MDRPGPCKICGSQAVERLGVDSFLIPSTSYAPNFHDYENYVCGGCGVVFAFPEVDATRLAQHYASAYWETRSALRLGGKSIELPVDFQLGATSFQRVKNFFDAIERNTRAIPEVVPGKGDLVIDYGAYQGLFLHGVSQLWGCRCLAYDHSEKGIAFARRLLGFADSRVATDVLSDTFVEKAKYVVLVHSLEHMNEPVRFLAHARANVLDERGFLYVEVPNLYGVPLCDPHHPFSYSKDSLTYLLRRSGFEVIDLITSGFPPNLEFLCRNDIENLVCLARPISGETFPSAPGANPEAIRRHMRRCYARHTARGLRRQLGTALRESARFVYYLVFAGILEAISPALALGVARALGLRRRRGTAPRPPVSSR